MSGTVNKLIKTRIQSNQYWSLYVFDNSGSYNTYSETAFFPETGKRYIVISNRGTVEIPSDLEVSSNDDLDKIYDKYKNNLAKVWNVKTGRCYKVFSISTGHKKSE